MTKEINDELKRAVNAFSVPEGAIIPEESVQKQEEIVDLPKGEPVVFTPSPYWNVIKETLGVEPPANLTAETEVDVFKQVLGNIQPVGPELHPLAADLNTKLADPEFKFESWISEINSRQNLMNLSGKDFMLKALAIDYPDATPEDIETAVDNLERSGMLKLQELEKKKLIKQQQAQEQTKFVEQEQKKQQDAITEANKRTEAELTTLFANSKKVTEIYGIPISEAERESFNNVFKELVKRDEKGKMPLMDILQSNEDIWKFAFFVLNGEPKIKEALFNAKEGSKAELWKNLRTTPSAGLGTPSGPTGPKPIDYKSLTRPQQ